MTLIECFTDAHVDNVMACLRLKPDKAVFIGNAQEMEVPVSRYKALFAQRSLHIEVEVCDSCCKDLWELYQVMYQVISREDACVVDLTGGDETVLMAMGAVLATLDASKRQNIRVERFDRERNEVVDCIRDNCPIPCKQVHLTVKELIELHGGSLYPKSYQPPASYKYKELDGLWKIVTGDPKLWNSVNSLLKEFENYAQSKMEVYLPIERLRDRISNMDEKEPIIRDLLGKLHRYGVIDDRSSYDTIEYTYRSDFLNYCINKAGNVLEIKTLLEGRSVTEDGKAYFQDSMMGVGIDWDGVVYKPEKRIPETRNEVDVVLMHGTTALFVSCKNGGIDDGELFKLHTVATRFGGPYAKKMLVATHLDRKNPAADRAFAQRAQDMGIFLVTDAAKLTHSQWQEIFRNAMKENTL